MHINPKLHLSLLPKVKNDDFYKNSNIEHTDMQRFENLILQIFAKKILYRVDSHFKIYKLLNQN